MSLATGFVNNATGLIVCRFFLGLVEAALFPGSSRSFASRLIRARSLGAYDTSTVFIMSSWYKPTELGLRITIMNAGNIMAQCVKSSVHSISEAHAFSLVEDLEACSQRKPLLLDSDRVCAILSDFIVSCVKTCGDQDGCSLGVSSISALTLCPWRQRHSL